MAETNDAAVRPDPAPALRAGRARTPLAHRLAGGSPAVGALALAVAVVATRLPFASQRLYAFDSANYALALRDYYNVAHHQPHPPGYPVYVALAKLIDLAVGEPNRSLVLTSILGSALAVAFTCLLGRALYGPRVGVAAGLVLLLTVGFWGYGEVAYPYVWLAAIGAGLSLLFWRVRAGRPGRLLTGPLMGLAAGFRWDAFAFLVPLWVLALVGSRPRAVLLALLGFVPAVLLWAVPMVQLSGGLASYLEATRLQSSYVIGQYSALAAGEFLRYNVNTLTTYLRQMLGPWLLVPVAMLWRFFAPSRLAGDERSRFLLIWLLPPLLVYWLVHIGDPGYVLSIAPPVAILTAAGLDLLGRDLAAATRVLAGRWPRWRTATRQAAPLANLVPVLVLLVGGLWQTNAFLNGVGPARLPEIRLIDRLVAGQTNWVRANLDPARSLVLAHDRYRQAQYYLRGYDVRLLFDEYAPGYERARRRLELSPAVEQVAVLDLDLGPALASDPRARRVALSNRPEEALWLIDVRGARALEHGYRYLRVVGTEAPRAVPVTVLPTDPEREWTPLGRGHPRRASF